VLPLGLFGFLLGPPGLHPLGGVLACLALPLLGPALGLLLLVGGHGARPPSSLPLALSFIALLLPVRARVLGIVFRSPLVCGARDVLNDNAALSTGAFDLGEVYA
jgi:hypothetical protein